jgi:type III restriction enzyme
MGRIQLIRKATDGGGNNRFIRLDLTDIAVRDKVIHAVSNDELDHIFNTDGIIE